MPLFAPLMRITDSIPDGILAARLQLIAVDKALRGEGVGSVLMNSWWMKSAPSRADRLGYPSTFQLRSGTTIPSNPTSEGAKNFSLPILRLGVSALLRQTDGGAAG